MTKFIVFILSIFALASCTKETIELPSPHTDLSMISDLLTGNEWFLSETYYLLNKVRLEPDKNAPPPGGSISINFNTNSTYDRSFGKDLCEEETIGHSGQWVFLNDNSQIGYLYSDSMYVSDIILLTQDSLILGKELTSEISSIEIYLRE